MKKGHAGLVQKKVTVKTKSGKTAQRSMWVKAGGAAKAAARAAGGFVGRHKGKIAGAAALAGAAVLAHKSGAIGGARLGHAMTKAWQAATPGKQGRIGTAADRVRGAVSGALHGIANNTKVGARIRDAHEHDTKVRDRMHGMAREMGVSINAPKKSLRDRVAGAFKRR